MAMSVETIRAGLRALRDHWALSGVEPKELSDKSLSCASARDQLRHMRWMVDTASEWPDERRDKMMRWLCFVQGALWAVGFVSIEEMKLMNAPPEVKQ